MKTTIIFFSALTLSVIYLPTFAQTPFAPPEPRAYNEAKDSQCLDLQPEQLRQIAALREWYEKAATPLIIMELERKSELRLLWMELKPAPETVAAKCREIADINWRIQEITIEYWLKFRDLLSVDQLPKFLMFTSGFEFRSPIDHFHPRLELIKPLPPRKRQ